MSIYASAALAHILLLLERFGSPIVRYRTAYSGDLGASSGVRDEHA